MYCANCGTQVPEGSAFCENCGARMESSPYISFDEASPPRRGSRSSRNSSRRGARRSLLWLVAAGSLAIAGLLIYLGVHSLTPQPADSGQGPAVLQEDIASPGAESTPEPDTTPVPFGASAEITVNWGGEPPDLDPQTSTDQVSFWILNASLEGLVRLNPDGSVGPGLAETWDLSDDGLTYTFHLRDALWSDGTAVTAGDFEYAWKRAIDPDTGSEYAYQMYHIVNAMEINTNEPGYTLDDAGVKAIDDFTLEVKLVRPTPFFLSLTSFTTYMPAQREAVERWGDDYATSADTMVFCGPFVVQKWVHEQELSLSKNEKYWDAGTVRLDSIHGLMITDENTAIQMYESDELDIVNVGPNFLYEYNENPEYMALPEATCWYLQFNCEDKYFGNLKIRKAFAQATDNQTYVNEIRAGLGKVADHFTPPTMMGKDGSANFEADMTAADIASMPPFDPAAAQKLLEEGLREIGATKKDLIAECTLLGGDGDTWATILQFLQGQWEQNLGIRLEIEQMTFGERLDRYNRGTYQVSYAGWGGDYDDPLTFLDMWVTDGGNNDAYWSDARYDACIDTAIAGEGDARIDAMVEAEDILARELPVYPIYWPTRSLMQKSRLHDVAYFPVGADTDFKWAWVDPPEGLGL